MQQLSVSTRAASDMLGHIPSLATNGLIDSEDYFRSVEMSNQWWELSFPTPVYVREIALHRSEFHGKWM